MSELAQERLVFIEALHAVFMTKKGVGAFAFVSIADVMRLFEQYKHSNESVKLLMRRYVNSI